jgi:hypothetical protein
LRVLWEPISPEKAGNEGNDGGNGARGRQRWVLLRGAWGSWLRGGARRSLGGGGGGGIRQDAAAKRTGRAGPDGAELGDGQLGTGVEEGTQRELIRSARDGGGDGSSERKASSGETASSSRRTPAESSGNGPSGGWRGGSALCLLAHPGGKRKLRLNGV